MSGVGFGFFEKKEKKNSERLKVVLANDFGFVLSLGYEFAFEFALSQ